MEGIEKNDFIIFARQNGNTVSASRTVPLILRNRERFFILLKVLLFFFFPFFFSCKVSKWPQLASDNSAARSCVPEVIVP